MTKYTNNNNTNNKEKDTPNCIFVRPSTVHCTVPRYNVLDKRVVMTHAFPLILEVFKARICRVNAECRMPNAVKCRTIFAECREIEFGGKFLVKININKCG